MSQATHTRHTPSLEPERWAALAAEANTTLPGLCVSVPAAELRQLLDHSRALPTAEAQAARLSTVEAERDEAVALAAHYRQLQQGHDAAMFAKSQHLLQAQEERDALVVKLEEARAQHKAEVLDILRDMRLPRLPLPGEETEDGEKNWEQDFVCGQNKERQAINDYCRQKAYEYDPQGIGPDPTKAGQWDTRPSGAAPLEAAVPAAGPVSFTPAPPTGCKCSFIGRILGDGCEKCQPERFTPEDCECELQHMTFEGEQGTFCAECGGLQVPAAALPTTGEGKLPAGSPVVVKGGPQNG